MKIGLLLPTLLASSQYEPGRIFAPVTPAVTLADGLVERGHSVQFYTAEDVKTKATVISGNMALANQNMQYHQFRNRSADEQQYTIREILKRDFENELTMKAYQDAMQGKLDIVHSYHDFSAHYFEAVTSFPTVYTVHNDLPQEKNTVEYHRYNTFRQHQYVSLSMSQRRSMVSLTFVANIHHGIDLADLAFQEKPGAHMVFIGRLLEDKGPGIAIQAALAANIPLHIATSANPSNMAGEYVDKEIKPFVDGKRVVIDGYVTGKEKGKFLGHAKAFVFPLQWEEPFGLVIIEAMACGTPVIAYNRGSASELIQDGVTGFIVDPDDADRPGKGSWVIKKQGMAGLVEALQRVSELDRAACRKHVEKYFTIEHMVDAYEKVYQQLA